MHMLFRINELKLGLENPNSFLTEQAICSLRLNDYMREPSVGSSLCHSLFKLNFALLKPNSNSPAHWKGKREKKPTFEETERL